MTTNLVDVPATDVARVRVPGSHPGMRLADVDGRPRSLMPVRTAVPAAAAATGWLRPEPQARGSRCVIATQDGRTAGFGGAYVATIKRSTRSGPPTCSPPA